MIAPDTDIEVHGIDTLGLLEENVRRVIRILRKHPQAGFSEFAALLLNDALRQAGLAPEFPFEETTIGQ